MIKDSLFEHKIQFEDSDFARLIYLACMTRDKKPSGMSAATNTIEVTIARVPLYLGVSYSSFMSDTIVI